MSSFWKTILVLLIFSIQGNNVFGQEKETAFLDFSGRFVTRGMTTLNAGELTDYGVVVSSLDLKIVYKPADWLFIKTTGAGLINYGTNNLLITDPITGSGPMYESNLWHPRNMTGTSEFILPELSLLFNHKSHSLEVGRFVKNTPLIKGEKWPFPTSLQGLWYNLETKKGWKFQAGLVNRIASRFIGEFQKLGNSIGQANVGVGLDGNKSLYYQNTSSDYLGIFNVTWQKQDEIKVQFWNYYVENISNSMFLETTIQLSKENGLSLSAQGLLQQRIGDGGNANPDLRYFTDKHSNSFGLRLDKKGKSDLIELNFNSIGSAGRVLLPREWGVEPFYTLQRRARIEGSGNATSVMLKYQRIVANEKRRFVLTSSIGSHSLTNPKEDYAANKYTQPSNVNLDFAVKYVPLHVLKGASLELFVLHRFLNEDIANEPVYIINRVNFTQFDLTFNYTF